MFRCLISVFVIMCVVGQCGEPSVIREQRIQIFVTKARTILEKNCKPEDNAKWNKAFKEKLAQKAQDKGNVTDQSVAIDYAIDYFNELRGKNVLLRSEKIETCRLLVYYVDNNLDLPSKVTDQMTKENYDKITERGAIGDLAN